MEVITMESQAFRELMSNISTVAGFVTALQNREDEKPSDSWVDSYDVYTFLKISPKTLQRLRAANAIGM